MLGGKYRVEAKIGEGGMGTVFRAENTVTGKKVALKWMHPHVAANPVAAERFLREARASSRLQHPNIVDVYDVVRDAGTLFLVMELLQGGTLRAFMTRRPKPSLTEFIALLLPAMGGVATAHEQRHVHRDLKPDNIFFVRAHGTARRLRQGARLRHRQAREQPRLDPDRDRVVLGHACVHVLRAAAW